MVSISVCLNKTCHDQQSPLVLRDIEELAGDGCHVQSCLCLGKCGMGPNVEITTDDVPVIYTGIGTWQRTIEVVEGIAQVRVSPHVAALGKLKYQARRAKDPETRARLLDQCLLMLGGEEEAETSDYVLFAQLLVLRSKHHLHKDADWAMRDARRAVQLMPAWAPAHVALAEVCRTTNQTSEGLNATEVALNLGGCIDTDLLRQQLIHLRQEQANPERFMAKSAREEVTRKLPTNIFTRFGGRQRLYELAHGVHELMMEHPSTRDFFPKTMNVNRITERNVDFLSGAFGGPKYVGPDMITTHEFLRITDEQYDRMLEFYVSVLKNMKVTEGHKQVILQQLQGMRNTIVYKPNRPPPNARHNKRFLELHKARKQHPTVENPLQSERQKGPESPSKFPAPAGTQTETRPVEPARQKGSQHPVMDPSVSCPFLALQFMSGEAAPDTPPVPLRSSPPVALLSNRDASPKSGVARLFGPKNSTRMYL
mmetsp:Transcript_11354/g.31684  ORF Transcript_11354/g.31684 Transcript_11354/m.31684 type:complete len:482 (-) Transcript_11354:223-1668(-)